jgi:hypothetical protein
MDQGGPIFSGKFHTRARFFGISAAFRPDFVGQDARIARNMAEEKGCGQPFCR